MEGYVVNLHIHERCNFHCKHCFAHFGSRQTLKVDAWKAIVDRIMIAIPVKRFNLAGGEPLLYDQLSQLIKYIKGMGVEVSIISNGYLMDEWRLDEYLGKVSMIGVSIDCLSHEGLINIGRCTVDGKSLE
ncbi:hypothetical protein FACS189476_11360 [Spirochaetia bacterium]|nr:hypothetical protein FACS189476_11360 [Spirochaetia bacterium]